ncbi:unnamed protein product [Haemonchus placei]|uniref:Transposase n=1 Tax=Haemonchus placei TaxID=6290 RepID=A0A0N4VZ57_HAEPC|nr:unnamed protein product [Haemonchus placei]
MYLFKRISKFYTAIETAELAVNLINKDIFWCFCDWLHLPKALTL